MEHPKCRDCGKRPVSPKLTTLCCACAARAVERNARGALMPPDRDDDESDSYRWTIESHDTRKQA